MWKRFQTDSAWGECKWPFWPFSPIRLGSLPPLFFHGVSIITRLYSPNYGIKTVPSEPYFSIQCGFLLYRIISHIYEITFLKPKSKFWHVHTSVCLRVQVLYSLSDGVPSRGTNRGGMERGIWGIPGGDRDPTEGSQTSCAHLASSLRMRTEGGGKHYGR